MASILNTGISALNAFQRQLNTTGHNIANVNTEGYSRQRVEFSTLEAQPGGDGFLGAGVQVAAIRRSYDDYLSGQVRAYSASQEEYAIYHERASQVDNVVADAASGLDRMMQEFFASIEDVSADPTSIPARNVMLNRSQVLTDRFRSLDGWMEDLRGQLNRDLDTFVSEVNGLGQALSQVNQQIQQISAGQANPPNDLLDKRDQLIDELSTYVKVTTVPQDNGALNVFIGNGQALVVGEVANRLSVINNPMAADQKEVAVSLVGGGTAVVTDQITGGKVGGLLRFRDEVLNPAQNSLGLVAVGLADSFNREHRTGLDLDGQLGGDYFALGEPELLADPANTGTVTASFDSIADLTNHEYQLSYDGSTWSLTDLTTGGSVTMTGAGTATNPFIADGVALVVGAPPAAGDTYLLRPARSGAGSIDTLINDTRDIAAADPIRTATADTNTGTGAIGPGALTSVSGSTLPATPITLTYDAVAKVFNLSTGGSVPYDPATDSGKSLIVTIAGLGDFTFEMTGTPNNGDQFSLLSNAGGTGDNRNALHLSKLQKRSLLFGNTATLSDAYGFMVADVATSTQQASANAEVQGELLSQSQAARSAVSGVNLDEEAADLVRFQQAYAAAAQVISTANTLFDTLLGAVRN
ncbi:MAG: flagellar hook-associated protein FlgK [Gammaproteobacteria bacterium]|nr:MAG: flagellar hook-associated protein FlgK [Gammaproteobacteria bacterium]